jgi:hypothetical protein
MTDEKKQRSIDAAASEMLEKTDREGASTAFDRMESMKPQCKFGAEGRTMAAA